MDLEQSSVVPAAGERVPRLMVVDDDNALGGIFGDLGKRAGYETLILRDSLQAVEGASRFAPDILIIDLMMPGMDGIEVLRQLGEARCRSRILIVSGADSRTLAAAKRLGEGFGLDVRAALPKHDAVPAIQSALNFNRNQSVADISADALSKAIEDNQLVLHFQPQVGVARRKPAQIQCVEALVRWNHPALGLLAPARFLPLAEQSGLMGALTDWVVEAAARQAAIWHRSRTVLDVAINLPASKVADLKFPDRLTEIFSAHGVPPERVVLEITEREALSDMMESLDVLTRLRLRGFTLSIDDFGCGYSTLSALHRMPFNELKIDRSLVSVATHDREAEIVTRTILSLARRMGLAVCAEGVEDQATFQAMAKWGCNKIQGFFISRPVPSEDLVLDRTEFA